MVGAPEINFSPLLFDQSQGASAVTYTTELCTAAFAIQIDKAAESARLSKELEQLDKVIASSEARLANEAFTAKAPAAVIDGARKQLAENQAKREELRRLLAALK
jgi:valyl-tRNA synthetase